MKKDYKLILAENLTIEGERIMLRPIGLSDAEDMFEYASDKETTRYVRFSPHQSVDETKSSIASFFMQEPLGKYGIILKGDNKYIGGIDIRINSDASRAELGYILNAKYQGNGYMTEAGKLILKLAFEQIELNSVFAKHDIRNPASGLVMERLGMKKDGIIRQEEFSDGIIADMVYYSILKEEYKNNLK